MLELRNKNHQPYNTEYKLDIRGQISSTIDRCMSRRAVARSTMDAFRRLGCTAVEPCTVFDIEPLSPPKVAGRRVPALQQSHRVTRLQLTTLCASHPAPAPPAPRIPTADRCCPKRPSFKATSLLAVPDF